MNSQQRSNAPFCLDTADHPNPLVRWVTPQLEHLFSLAALNKIYATLDPQSTPQVFMHATMQALGTGYTISDADRSRIPSSGPVVVVANHPFGGIEGMVLASVLLSVRADVRVVANELLGRIPPLRDLFIFVNAFETEHSIRANIRGLRETLAWMRQGGMLGVFPAGEVANINLRSGKVVDRPWSENVARLLRAGNASVLPVYFHGSNGPMFQLAGLVHPILRTALLARELVNKRGQTIEMRVGSLITPRMIADFPSDRALIDYLRERTYTLSSRNYREHHWPRLTLHPPTKTIAPARAAERLRAEVADLPEQQRLAEHNELHVYQATAAQIPHLLDEIGRLREVTFREVGEGTGKARDLDRFDRDYLHLFVWNSDKHEVVGAYRLGLTDQLMRLRGVQGLYTSTLFRYPSSFIERITPAIELGRSFIRSEYQRSFAPLMLLWRGIGQYVMQQPQYRYIFGPVSISSRYTSMSRWLMMAFLRQKHHRHDLAALVRPRRPARQRVRAAWSPEQLSRLTPDIDLLTETIQDIESDRKGLPILLKQYLKLGAQVLAFNLDPDFANALDALVLMDLVTTDERVLQRYVGKEQAETFLAYHRAEMAE
jgi:putative hemolysin